MSLASPVLLRSPICSIVIRAFNEEKPIERLLQGINQQTLKDIQILLVDSGSTDQTVEVAKAGGAEIIHIPPEEFTFGRSLNIGIEHAKADLVVIGSAHIYPVYPDWLERLIEPFKEPKVILVYGKQRGNEESRFSERQLLNHWYPDHSNDNQTHPFCNNANAAIRKSMWEVHRYNENLPALEDLDWARWAHDQGNWIAYCAEAEVVHVHHESWTAIANRYEREGMAFKQIYPHENFHIWDLARLWVKNTLSDWTEARKDHVFAREWMNCVRFRWNQFLGTYRGYHQSGPLTWRLKQAFYYPRSPQGLNSEKRKVEPIEYSQKEKN